MPMRDKIALGPLEKFVRYGKFPFKLIVHMLLLIFLSIEVAHWWGLHHYQPIRGTHEGANQGVLLLLPCCWRQVQRRGLWQHATHIHHRRLHIHHQLIGASNIVFKIYNGINNTITGYLLPVSFNVMAYLTYANKTKNVESFPINITNLGVFQKDYFIIKVYSYSEPAW